MKSRTATQDTVLVLSCEHGGNTIPVQYSNLFSTSKAKRALASHRGYDPGALVATSVFSSLATAVFTSTESRLLVDFNRSLDHPQLFSEFSCCLDVKERRSLLKSSYLPYRESITKRIRRLIEDGRRVVHVGVHSFTPVFGGKPRHIDIGWLYDPKRSFEKAFCDRWISATAKQLPETRLRRNAPYTGTSDGLTTSLRTQFSDEQYAGIELELSQGFSRYEERLMPIAQALKSTLEQTIRLSTPSAG
jgi:predicted N-formylglutamate amidohydrolase